MKKIALGIGVIAVLIIGWYLISPAFIVVEVDDVSPLESPGLAIDDTLESMDSETKATFDRKVEEMKDEIVEMDDEMPAASDSSDDTGPSVVASGDFMPRAHEVEGKALLISSAGSKVLRFEDFFTINGPELHIYLSKDLSDTDVIDLGIIKATKGNVNYEIPAGVDTSVYSHVLVWCKPFKVLFSYAQLN